MNTLKIPQIFSNLSFYKENYLSILSSEASYFTEVEGAYVDLFPFKKQRLYLGDLLQLWFSEKWSDEAPKAHLLEEYLAATDVKNSAKNHVYIYCIKGNAVTGLNSSQAWSQLSSTVENLSLRFPLKYYVELVNCPRPSSDTVLNHSKSVSGSRSVPNIH